MLRKPNVQVVLALIVVAILLTAAAKVQVVRDDRYAAVASVTLEDTLYITSGKALRRMTAGYQALTADVYWIRSIQYYGDRQRDPQAHQDGFKLLYPLLDLTTTLDPHFNIAYRFGAIFLSEPAPGGPGRPDLAIALLEKGLKESPERWEYPMDIGFVHYWHTHDYQSAADWFERAGQIAGAPWWLKSMAATTRVRGGDRDASRAMWQEIGRTAGNDWLRHAAERALLQLRALDEIDVLQRQVDLVTPPNGVAPNDWAPVFHGRGVPMDPSGVPYIIVSGRVTVDQKSQLFPLPTDQGREAPPIR